MSARPIKAKWDGNVMVPLDRRAAARIFEVDKSYELTVREPASSISRKHLFAAIDDVWSALPEDGVKAFPTPTHLRKALLIQAGYVDIKTIGMKSAKEAMRMAAVCRDCDEFCAIGVEGSVVTVVTAKSLSKEESDRAGFQRVKQDCIEILAGMIGVSPDDLARNAGAAA